jgi:hypothetical protein
MKIIRLTTLVVLIAGIGAPLVGLPPDAADALEITPTRPITPLPTNPVFPIVRLRYFGPERELCAANSGALKICALPSGTISLGGPSCRNGSTEVDLRAVRNSSPPTWFGTGNLPPPFQVIAPIRPPIRPTFPIDEPRPFPFPTAKVLCKRGTRVALREACLSNESTVHPSAVMACMTRAGSVSIQAGACDVRETRLDLRAVRGPSSHPVGIGPLVGLVPSLADLVAEYP